MIKEKPQKLPVLETERLVLRPFNENDADALFAYASEPDVGPPCGWKPHESVEESREILKMFEGMYAVYAITLKGDNIQSNNREMQAELNPFYQFKPVGSISLNPSKREGVIYDLELGYALSKHYWGRGIMTEAAKRMIRFAFEDADAGSVYVSHFTFNGRSRRVIEKCGFKYHKLLEKSWKNYDGRLLDEHCFLMSREDYLALSH